MVRKRLDVEFFFSDDLGEIQNIIRNNLAFNVNLGLIEFVKDFNMKSLDVSHYKKGVVYLFILPSDIECYF